MTFDQRRRWVDDLRRIPLVAVLNAAGASQDRHDPAKWHTDRGVLSVNGVKFIDWNQGRGGGGAIDLAMHLRAIDFNSAVQWLTQRFPSAGSPACAAAAGRPACAAAAGRPPSAPTPSKPNLALPQPNSAHLGSVRRYLVGQRRLPAPLLESLIQAGKLYADIRANAVFLLLGPNAQPVGAELRGTCGGSWRGLAPGSCKDRGYFSVGPAQAPVVVLCESAIDAISCAVRHPGHLCISTSGARPNPAWLAPMLALDLRLYCGFDADPTGDYMAEAMIALHPSVQRLRPPLHDWNDVLQASA